MARMSPPGANYHVVCEYDLSISKIKINDRHVRPFSYWVFRPPRKSNRIVRTCESRFFFYRLHVDLGFPSWNAFGKSSGTHPAVIPALRPCNATVRLRTSSSTASWKMLTVMFCTTMPRNHINVFVANNNGTPVLWIICHADTSILCFLFSNIWGTYLIFRTALEWPLYSKLSQHDVKRAPLSNSDFCFQNTNHRN